jgi:glycine/D-amino acid oxidase-like deaminating enzyme
MRDAGINVDDVFFSGAGTAENFSGIKGAKACFSSTAGHLYPYKLVTHLLQKAIVAGVNLQTTTPVTDVSSEPDGEGRWTVVTARGNILARKVIYATNGYSAGLLPELEGKIVPVRGICSRIVCPGNKRPPLLTNSYVMRFNDWEYDYLIARTDGSIVVGGARQDYYHQLDSWFNVYDDSKLMESAKNYFDGYMQRHFHGWEESGAYTEQVWTGIMGYTTVSEIISRCFGMVA